MNLMVTGGLGFIGSNFIRSTLNDDVYDKIINIDKIGIGSNLDNLKDVSNNEKYQFIKGDITNSDLIEKYLNNIDIIINFAAETHVDRSITNPEPFVKSNIIGTFVLLEAQRKINKEIKHVQVSTDEIYGDILEGSFTEEDILKPSNPYSATKASADLLCLAYNRTYNLNISITRCTNNFGEYQNPEKLIPKTITNAISNKTIPIYGTGESIRDWLYVKDHCEAIKLVTERGKPGEVYNISSGNLLSVNKIVKHILKQLTKPETLMKKVDDRPGHDIRYSLDCEKIKREIGWKPLHNFENQLNRTVDWYLNNEQWWKPLLMDKEL